jgi:hypothetical protein
MAEIEEVDKVLWLMNEVEKDKKPSIDALLAQRAEIDAQLVQQGYVLKAGAGSKRAH